jgi:hypothetical protein
MQPEYRADGSRNQPIPLFVHRKPSARRPGSLAAGEPFLSEKRARFHYEEMG